LDRLQQIPPRRGDRFWDRVAAISVARPWLLVLIGAAVLASTAPFAARLYGDLRTDLRELLPQGAPAAVGLEELEKRVGGLSSLAIVVRTEDLKAAERFADALAARIRAMPPELVARVYYRIDDEKAFFEAHGALYADLADLQQVRDAVRTKLDEAKKAANPLVVNLDEDEPKPAPKDDAALQEAVGRLRAAFGRLDHFIDGYLAGEGGKTLVLLVSPPGAAVSLEDDQKLFRAVETAVRELDPKSFHPSIRIGYGGEVRGVIEAQEALVRDLLVSSALVLSAVALALLLFYRSWRSIPLLVLPLFTGVAATFAISRWVIHYLNPNTAFLGSIIVGNGINAGIILLARYFEERRRGFEVAEALPTALKTTWVATFAASAAAAASYGSLGAVSFRGFNQFGFMGTLGMLLCWVATYAFMPPLVVLAERVRPLREKKVSRITGWVAGPYATALTRHTGFVTAVSVLVLAGSAWGMWRFVRQPIQYDFRQLGSRRGLTDGASYWDNHVDAVLQSYQTPTVVLNETPEKAQAVAAALEKEREAQGPSGTIDSVLTLQKLLPDEQPRKIELLREIFDLVTPRGGRPGLVDTRILDALPPDLRPSILRLRERTHLTTITLDDVPARLKAPFHEKDGRSGRLVLVYPTLATDSRHGKMQIAHAKLVQATAARVDPNSLVAGQIVLTADIVDSITSDGGFAATLSFLAVAALTVLVMRSLRDSLWVLSSLCLGVFWMFGALGALSLRLNFVNFAVLPITFGIGVDYAVNFYQRYRQSSGVEEALATSGGAVTLCSTSTIIGYATLVTADNMAIQSFGLTAVIGEVTCLSAALFALPALLAWRDRRRAQREAVPEILPPPAGPVLQAEPRGEAQGL
jgi:predicted RND superfamily exporter protein